MPCPRCPARSFILKGRAPRPLFAALLGLGVALQALGVYRTGRGGLRWALFGAALVVGAGLFDRDPALVVGQLVLGAALWPVTAKKFDKSTPGPAQKGR